MCSYMSYIVKLTPKVGHMPEVMRKFDLIFLERKACSA